MEFLDTSGNRRLGIFPQVLDVVERSTEDPRQLHRSLVEIMRKAYAMRCYAEISTEKLAAGEYRLTRVWREDGTEGVEDHSPWRIDGVPIRRGGIIPELIAHGRAGAVNRMNIAPGDPVFAELGRYHSIAIAPGGLGERHNWVLVLETREDAFTADDVEGLALRVTLIGLSLKNLGTLGELRHAKAIIDSEVDRIAAIQKSLLPPESPQVPGLRLAARSETYDRAGGDLYDYAQMSDGRW